MLNLAWRLEKGTGRERGGPGCGAKRREREIRLEILSGLPRVSFLLSSDWFVGEPSLLNRSPKPIKSIIIDRPSSFVRTTINSSVHGGRGTTSQSYLDNTRRMMMLFTIERRHSVRCFHNKHESRKKTNCFLNTRTQTIHNNVNSNQSLGMSWLIAFIIKSFQLRFKFFCVPLAHARNTTRPCNVAQNISRAPVYSAKRPLLLSCSFVLSMPGSEFCSLRG